MKKGVFQIIALVVGLLLLLLWIDSATTKLDPLLIRKAEMEYTYKKGRLNIQRYITIIDYRQSILQKRLWVYDRTERRVVLNARVSHAFNSGLLYASNFSNVDGTNKSCTGSFITLSPYQGQFGYSMRIKGVTKGVNTNALSRAIVFHPGIAYRGFTYSGPTYSFGCFVTNPETNTRLINLIKGGSLVYVRK